LPVPRVFFYNTRIMRRDDEAARHLRFDEIAPGGAMHAALFSVRAPRGFSVALHDHDFYEILFVLAGGARHVLNGSEERLQPGLLMFLRPPDCHAIHLRPRERLHHINVAFPAAAWRAFREAAGIGEAWETGETPRSLLVPEERRAACARVFENALHVFPRHPSPTQRLDLCRFLADALPFLLPESAEETEEDIPAAPAWLADACRAFRRDPAHLIDGLPRLVALSGVSASHLARSLKAATGRTPTEYINGLRLRRAAFLLTTTDLAIAEIAAECGFAQLSYFYRLFAARYDLPPHAYRQRARRSVAPGDH
jgi:AraC-like DNA-binding protein/quercetin dioxygenase-like cupin family protein